jgi:hypothetical protein
MASSPGTPSLRRTEPAATSTARAATSSASQCRTWRWPFAGETQHGIERELGAGFLGTLLQFRPQFETGDAARKTRHVVDPFDVHHLTARAHALDDQHPHSQAGRLGRGAQSSDTRAYDRQVGFTHRLQRHSSMDTVALWCAPMICQ